MPGTDSSLVTTPPAAVRARPPAAVRGAHWRRLLEDRWQDRLVQVTEAALAYHDAAAAAGSPGPRPALHDMLCRAAAARRSLADIEDALTRLAGGRFGLCESCGGVIPARRLAALPECRYCPQCEAAALPAPRARRPVTASGPVTAPGPVTGAPAAPRSAVR